MFNHNKTIEEKMALDKLMMNITSTMQRFRHATGKKQNDEQIQGLIQIKKEFNNSGLTSYKMYFVGRISTVGCTVLHNKIAQATLNLPKDPTELRHMGYDMPHFEAKKMVAHSFIKEFIARRLGLSQIKDSAIIVLEPSSMESLYKVSLNGEIINNFIAQKLQPKNELLQSMLVDLTIEIFKALSGDATVNWTMGNDQILSPHYSFSEANVRFNIIKAKLEKIGIDSGANLMFLSDSSLKEKQRIVIDYEKFMNEIYHTSIDNIKNLIPKNPLAGYDKVLNLIQQETEPRPTSSMQLT